MSPAVSIVTTTYNYGHYLGSMIESVLAQTFGDWELILVDDGSTDNTRDVVDGYRAERRIQYHGGSRQGLAAARNKGIALSQAPLVALLDADDLWMPTKLARQVPLFAADPRVGVVYSRRLLMGPAGEDLPVTQPKMHRGRLLARIFHSNAFICSSTLVMRRDLLDAVGRFGDVPLAVDYDLLLRLADRCRFDYVDEPLCRYRTGHANMSRRSEERLRVALSIMDRAVERYGPRIPRRVVRSAYAETHAHLGLACRDRSRMAALVEYGRALRAVPGRAATWKGLASLFLPEGARRMARRALGRPADWRRRFATETAQTSPACGSQWESQKAALKEMAGTVKDSPH